MSLTDVLSERNSIQRLEQRARRAIQERREEYVTTDATGCRSVSKRKPKHQQRYEQGLIDAYCEALYLLGWRERLTPFAVQLELQREMFGEE